MNTPPKARGRSSGQEARAHHGGAFGPSRAGSPRREGPPAQSVRGAASPAFTTGQLHGRPVRLRREPGRQPAPVTGHPSRETGRLLLVGGRVIHRMIANVIYLLCDLLDYFVSFQTHSLSLVHGAGASPLTEGRARARTGIRGRQGKRDGKRCWRRASVRAQRGGAAHRGEPRPRHRARRGALKRYPPDPFRKTAPSHLVDVVEHQPLDDAGASAHDAVGEGSLRRTARRLVSEAKPCLRLRARVARPLASMRSRAITHLVLHAPQRDESSDPTPSARVRGTGGVRERRRRRERRLAAVRTGIPVAGTPGAGGGRAGHRARHDPPVRRRSGARRGGRFEAHRQRRRPAEFAAAPQRRSGLRPVRGSHRGQGRRQVLGRGSVRRERQCPCGDRPGRRRVHAREPRS